MDSEMLPGGIGGAVGQHRSFAPAKIQHGLPSDGNLPDGWKRKADKKKGTAQYFNPDIASWQNDP